MDLVFHVLRKASNWAPSVVLLWAFFQHVSYADGCLPDTFDAQVEVSFVYDGDTVKLKDGRKVRFIGINTPERGKDHQAAEPFYAQAREYLVQQLQANHNQIQLKFGQQSKDRYGRSLAHPFIGKRINLTQLLLEQGFGFALAIPPNLDFNDCYQTSEQKARQLRKGIWSHPFSQSIKAAELTNNNQGYRRIQGTVQRIGESRSAYWLNLSKHFALRIKKDDLIHFTQYHPRDLLHKQLIAQGWITLRNNELRMTVRHPAALTLLKTD